MRLQRLFKTITLMGTLIVCSATLVSASASCNITSGGCTCGGCDVSPIAWNQSNKGNKVNANWSDIRMGGADTIASSGCFATSLAIQMAMSGDFGDKFCPAGLFNWGNEHSLWSGGGDINPSVLTQIEGYNDIFRGLGIDKEAIKDMKLNFSRDDKVGDSGGGYEKKDMYGLAIDLASKGVYVILEMDYEGGWNMCHYVPVIGTVKSNNEFGAELIIADPASDADDVKGARVVLNKTDTANNVDGYSCADVNGSGVPYTYQNIVSLRVYISATKFTGKVNATNSGSLADKQKQANFNYKGVASYLEEEYFVDISRLEELALTLPTYSEFVSLNGIDDGVEVKNWADSVSLKNSDKVTNYVRAGFMFVGILIVVYSLFLFLAFQLDTVNNFVDFSLLGVLSFKRLMASTDDESSTYNSENTGGTKVVTFKDICVISVVGISIGVLMISGKMFLMVLSLIGLISKIFNEFL